MAQVLNKENITIVTGTYKDKQTGQEKSRYRTIGELVTMRGDDGSTYQFGEIWGPHGCTKFNVYAQEDRQNAVNQAGGGYQQSNHPPSQAQQGYGSQQPQGGFNGHNNGPGF